MYGGVACGRTLSLYPAHTNSHSTFTYPTDCFSLEAADRPICSGSQMFPERFFRQCRAAFQTLFFCQNTSARHDHCGLKDTDSDINLRTPSVYSHRHTPVTHTKKCINSLHHYVSRTSTKADCSSDTIRREFHSCHLFFLFRERLGAAARGQSPHHREAEEEMTGFPTPIKQAAQSSVHPEPVLSRQRWTRALPAAPMNTGGES